MDENRKKVLELIEKWIKEEEEREKGDKRERGEDIDGNGFGPSTSTASDNKR